jgi:hypothetical protein
MALARPAQCTEAVFLARATMASLHLRRRFVPTVPASRAGHPGLDASAAIISALVAGSVVLIAWMACSMAIYDESPWKLPRMMAAMATGPGALSPDDELDLTLVATGLVLHFVLALSFGAVLALLLRPLPDGAVAAAGAIFGVALYALDLHGMAPFFPWFAPLRTLDTLAAHVLFGLVAATAYRDLALPARQRGRPR